MAPTTAALEEKTTTAEDDAMCMELTAAGSPVRHIHHQAYACWDSEETLEPGADDYNTARHTANLVIAGQFIQRG
jgi:hypothetical protein